MDKALACVIMAAGEGTRMKSDYPKVMHEVAGEPMISHVLEASSAAAPSRTIVIIGFGGELLKAKLPRDAECVQQKRQLGTGHALMQAKDKLKDFKGELLVLCGDTPLLRPETLVSLLEKHRLENASAAVLTAILPNPAGYGRIIRHNDRIVKIIEEKDATIYEKAIEEVNSGTYCFNSDTVFSFLEEIMPENRSKEYYLTDIIEIMTKRRQKVLAVTTEDRDEILGVNSREQLAIVNKILHRRIAQAHMENGVTIVDPETTFIDKRVKIGRDSVIYPFTILEGETAIGERCRVGPYAHLISAKLCDLVICRQCVIRERQIKRGKEISAYNVL